jgi:hypothetical protein
VPVQAGEGFLHGVPSVLRIEGHQIGEPLQRQLPGSDEILERGGLLLLSHGGSCLAHDLPHAILPDSLQRVGDESAP